MSEHLVLVSHGRFCEELKKSAEMIMGPQETLSTVALLPEEGEADFLEKFEAITESLEDFVVFADLLGGTPCNILSKKIMQGASFDLYTGMNLPMVISYVNASLLAIEGDYVKESAESIVKVNELLLNVAVDDEDE